MTNGGFLKPFGDDARFLKWKKNASASLFKVPVVRGYTQDSTQGWLSASAGNTTEGHIVIRAANGQIKVPTTPDNDDDAVSKSYVDSTLVGKPKYYAHGVCVVTLKDFDTGSDSDYFLHVPMSFVTNTSTGSGSSPSDFYMTMGRIFTNPNANGTGIGPVLLCSKNNSSKEIAWCHLERYQDSDGIYRMAVLVYTSSGDKKFAYSSCNTVYGVSASFGF